jgi:hypothetical protein
MINGSQVSLFLIIPRFVHDPPTGSLHFSVSGKNDPRIVAPLVIGVVMYNRGLDDPFAIELPTGDGLEKAPGVGGVENKLAFSVLPSAATADTLDQGGDAEGGIQLGDEIYGAGWLIRVFGRLWLFCIASTYQHKEDECANYDGSKHFRGKELKVNILFLAPVFT